MPWGSLRGVLRSQESLAETLERLQRFPNNPWDRISDEVSGLGGVLEKFKAEGLEGLESDGGVENSDEAIDRFLDLVGDGAHITEELKAFATAWRGAIDFQEQKASGLLSAEALPLERLVPILAGFVLPEEVAQ